MLLTAFVLAALAALPSASVAHQSNPDFESTVRAINPPTKWLAATIVGGDDTIVLVNRSEKTVIVEGYENEPYIRIDADGGTFVNERSPALYLNEDRYAKVEVPDVADPDASPKWRRVGSGNRYEWHDHRAHWMGEGKPPSISDPAVRTKVFDWKVPITVGGTGGAIAGDLYWRGDEVVAAPKSAATVVFASFVAVMIVAGLAILLLRRRRRNRNEPEPGARESW